MLNTLLNILFPPKCIFCGNIMGINTRINICTNCYNMIPFTNEYFTGSSTGSGLEQACDSVLCMCEYSGIVKQSLKKYKFFNKPSYYRTFAKLLSDSIIKIISSNIFDIVISVPLYKSKESIRGYNQSFLISKVISKELNITEGSKYMIRVKDTQSQSLLTANKRHENVKGAFKAGNVEKIINKNVLLIDDIMTTGYTLDECSRVLKEAGAKSVIAAVIASGRKSKIRKW